MSSPGLYVLSASVALGLRGVLTILAPLSAYFLLLSYVPLPDAIASSGMSNTFTLVTARYNVLGIFILGSLSGFGSVTTAWGYFPLRCGKNRHVTVIVLFLLPQQIPEV
jgi:hypothetical protein